VFCPRKGDLFRKKIKGFVISSVVIRKNRIFFVAGTILAPRALKYVLLVIASQGSSSIRLRQLSSLTLRYAQMKGKIEGKAHFYNSFWPFCISQFKQKKEPEI
jgi:hypothetical protein